jgi:hypothetical protein
MDLKCGIVGLPNVGKSTLFNAITQNGIAAENYPFCTIEPNVGIVAVPDPRLDALANIVSPEKVLPTTVQFVDIAGLVKGAASGEGLGNQFLSHIRETQAIVHVVRCFEDNDIIHVAGRVDPAEDIAVIDMELALADLDTVSKAKLKAEKAAKTGDKEAKQFMDVLTTVAEKLNQGITVRRMGLNEEERNWLKPYNLLTAKPVLYIANVAMDGFQNNPLLKTVEEIAKEENARVVAISAQFESELASLDEADKKAFLAEMNLTEPGLNRVIRAGYDLLSLITFFTAGKKEVRAWTITKGSSAPVAAGEIHTDFMKGFIRAEVISYEDYIQYQGELGAKEKGKLRLEGKNYIVQDGDVMHFLFNV